MFDNKVQLAFEHYEPTDELYYKVVKEMERKRKLYHLNNRCDYCSNSFSTCSCRCGMCGDSFDICNYSNCRYECHNNSWTMTYIKYMLLHKPKDQLKYEEEMRETMIRQIERESTLLEEEYDEEARIWFQDM